MNDIIQSCMNPTYKYCANPQIFWHGTNLRIQLFETC